MQISYISSRAPSRLKRNIAGVISALGLMHNVHANLAPTQSYSIFFDTDSKSEQGCDVVVNDINGPRTLKGIEYRINVGVDLLGRTVAPTLATCLPAGNNSTATAFSPDVPHWPTPLKPQ